MVFCVTYGRTWTPTGRTCGSQSSTIPCTLAPCGRPSASCSPAGRWSANTRLGKSHEACGAHAGEMRLPVGWAAVTPRGPPRKAPGDSRPQTRPPFRIPAKLAAAHPTPATHASPADAPRVSCDFPKVPKRRAGDRHTVVSYERGLLEDCLSQALFAVDKAFRHSFLERVHPGGRTLQDQVREHLGLPDGAEVLVAPEACINGQRVCASDVVVFKGPGGDLQPGMVEQHMEILGQALTAISVWELDRQEERCARCIVRDTIVLVDTTSIVQAAIHEPADVGSASIVLKPFPRAFVL